MNESVITQALLANIEVLVHSCRSLEHLLINIKWPILITLQWFLII
jgi:hypothetical protein